MVNFETDGREMKDHTGFNRKSVPALEYLKKCQGEIERYLYAAEIFCDGKECIGKECKFMICGECVLYKIRDCLPHDSQ